MAALFTVSDGRVRTLSAAQFGQTHAEVDLQRWADAYPHLLNEGVPMLSLGTEIATHHGYAIDNLFIDGNGCLVVGELKRGPSPKDVIAQTVNYAAYVSQLRWPDIEAFCRQRHSADLDSAFKGCFGRPLARDETIDHRLVILAESYDPRVTDAALYLINNGTPLALLQFSYFQVGDSEVVEVRTALGEIPEQRGAPAGSDAGTPAEGRINWLLSSVAEQVPEIARRHGWPLRYVVNKRSLPIFSERWPTKLSQCQLVLAWWSGEKLSFRLTFRDEDLPGLREFLEERRDQWYEAFPAEFANPPYRIVYANLGYDIPMPEMGDTGALADVVDWTERMVTVMVPLVDEYFARR